MKKALLYLFGFVLIQFFVSWAVYAVWMLCSGDSGADVWRTFCSGNSAALTGPMLIAASAASSVVAGAVFIWRRFAVVSPTYLRTRPGAYSSGAPWPLWALLRLQRVCKSFCRNCLTL